MTEQTQSPKVVALNVTQWKAVVLSDLSLLHQALSNIHAPTDIDIANIDQFVANTRNMLYGWKVAGAQATAQAQAAQDAGQAGNSGAVAVQEHSAGNGAVIVKKRGGWPAGKPRKAKAVQPVAQ